MASRVIPFPFPLRVGTDICQISRIQRILQSPRAPRFVRRVLTAEEISRPDQDPLTITLKATESRLAQGQESNAPTSQLQKAAAFMAGR